MKLQLFSGWNRKLTLAVFLALWTLSLGLCAAFAQTTPWQQTNGPEGGTINVVAINKSNGYIFIVVEGVGVLRSADNGESWTPKNSGLTNLNVQTVALNANGDIFVGTSGQGIFRSTDHGENWSQINTGIATTHRNVRALSVKLSSGDIFAGTSAHGLYRSSDNGDTWTQLMTGLTGTGVIQALALNQATHDVFAGTDKNGVLHSADNGDTWTFADTSSIYKNVQALLVTSNGDIFAGADSAFSKRAILRSSNNGESWELLLEPSSSVAWFALNASEHIWAGTFGSGVYFSSDHGDTWTLRNTGLRGYTVKSLALNANDDIFAGTHCAGVFRSTDGGANWNTRNSALRYTEILSLANNHITGITVAGTHCGGVFRSNDNGNNWEWASLAGATVQALIALPNGYFLAGTSRIFPLETQGDIFRSTDNGVTWARVTPDNDAYFSFATNARGDTMYAGTGFYQVCGFLCVADYGDIYRSANYGGTWTRVASQLDDFVYALTVDANGRVYAGTGEGVYRSRGGFWDKVRNGDVRSLMIQPTTGYIFAGMTGAIHRSSADGWSWGVVRSQPNNAAWALAANASGQLYAGTQSSGVLRSLDDGITWASFNTGMGSKPIRAFAVDHSNRQIFSGTNGQGVFLYQDAPALSNAKMFPVVASEQNVGEEFWVEVAIDSAQNLFDASFELNYSNTAYVDVVVPHGNNIIPGAFLGADVEFEHAVDEVAGKVSIGISRRTGLGGVNGSGVVALMKFVSPANTPASTQIIFMLDSLVARDPSGNPITITALGDTTTLLRVQPVCSGPAIFPARPGSTTVSDPIGARDGDTLFVDIRMQQNAAPVDAFSFTTQVNPGHLDFISAQPGDLTTNFLSVSAQENPPGSGTLTCGGYGLTAIPANSAGALMRLKFVMNCTQADTSLVALSNPRDDLVGMMTCSNIVVCAACSNDGDVTNDGSLTPGDALCAFQIFLNNGQLTSGCDVPNFDCEVIAADVTCDGSVTPGDALAIFQRFLAQQPPAECFGRAALQRAGQNHQLTLEPSSANSSAGIFKLAVKIAQPAGLRAFGFKLHYPSAKLNLLGIERGALTQTWTQLEGREQKPGEAIIGGFHIDPIATTTTNELLFVHFEQREEVQANELMLTELTDDLHGASWQVASSALAKSSAIPARFKLHQSFPNPFGNRGEMSTLIRFDLPGNETHKVEVAIYNITGQLVRKLVSGEKAPGAHEASWDGRDEAGKVVPAGVYFYRLHAGDFIKVLKLTLVR